MNASRHTVRVTLGERSYDIGIGPGALADLGAAVAGLGNVSTVMLVTNPTVRALYGERALHALGEVLADAPSVMEIDDGERFKTVATLETIYDAALDAGADRDSVIVALGGGVVGDVAGFAAATLLRGVRLVMAPTTLLAQVDSSVGGKTGVNRRQGKNLVGTFYQPAAVISDTTTLATLPEREYRAGLAEVVKYGVILDAELFSLLESRAGDLVARDVELVTEIVARSVALKARVVERDETETGLRAILNFGHTVGHAIEQATGYTRYLHGEAVALGMLAAARVSIIQGACGVKVLERIERLLAALGLETELPVDIDRGTVERAVAIDKKVRRDHVNFVVVDAVGRCSQRPLTPADICAALQI